MAVLKSDEAAISSTRKKEEESDPGIKSEEVEDNPFVAGFEEVGDFDDELESLITDQEGTQYYCDAGFRIKQVSDPVIINYTLQSLFIVSRTEALKLDPEYQRDVVWDEARSSGLIASIFQGYFIPPIIFNKISEYDRSGKKLLRTYRICVDGKQRLTSVKSFMEGFIGVPDSSSPPKRWYFCHPIINGVQQASGHNILPDTTKNFFQNRTFCCYEYDNLPASVEENMFQLVQRGVPLTPAERMRAISTNWAAFGKKIEQDYSQVVNLSKQSRASGFRCVITIFSQVKEVISQKEDINYNRERYDSNPTLHAAPQTLTRLLLDERSLTDHYRRKYKEIFDKFQELVDLSSTKYPYTKQGYKITPNSAFDATPNYLSSQNLNHVKTFSPLELVAAATMIAVYGSSRSAVTLLEDIKEMRVYLRRQHQDLRLNNQCWVTAWRFIEAAELLNDRQLLLGRGAAKSLDKAVDEPVAAGRPGQSPLSSGRSVGAIEAESMTKTSHLSSNGLAGSGESSGTGDVEDIARTSGVMSPPAHILSPWRLADTMSDSGGPVSRMEGLAGIAGAEVSIGNDVQTTMDIDG